MSCTTSGQSNLTKGRIAAIHGWADVSPHPKQHLLLSCDFAGLTIVTDRPHYSVCNQDLKWGKEVPVWNPSSSSPFSSLKRLNRSRCSMGCWVVWVHAGITWGVDASTGRGHFGRCVADWKNCNAHRIWGLGKRVICAKNRLTDLKDLHVVWRILSSCARNCLIRGRKDSTCIKILVAISEITDPDLPIHCMQPLWRYDDV